MKVIKEMPPDLDNKREITEVQVLEEGQVFDVDAFLASIPKPGMTQPQSLRCLVDMTFGSIQHEDGSQFQYYRCPMTRFNTKCYVTSSKENLATYLKAVDEQTHPVYATIPPERFKCECDLSMILAVSKSENNPSRLYLKCPKRNCKLFQWINQPPRGLAFKPLQQTDYL